MEKLKILLLVSAGIVILSMMLSLTRTGHVGAAGSAPVTVVNTAANPVPVTGNVVTSGTVDVGNFPATQNVRGTVNIGNRPTVDVGNFPATQNVNITGGTVNATPSVATQHRNHFFSLGCCGRTGGEFFGDTINASLILLEVSDDVTVFFGGENGNLFQTRVNHEFRQIALTQRIPIKSVLVTCNNDLFSCEGSVTIIGD